MSNIRKYIIPREDDGVLLELDFSQLEIVVLAHLSDDGSLKHDLLSGVDLHNVSAASLFGKGFTKDQRRIAKQFSFQLQYGAGYKSMAASANMPEELAKQFIEQYYTRYPGVKMYQERLQEHVAAKRQLKANKRTAQGYPAGTSKFQSETGRIYTFTEGDAPDWMKEATWGRNTGKTTTFSPTKVKNYQVQGYATGDIVPVVLGALWRTMNKFNMKTRDVYLINTVHDSVLFDCASEAVGMEWAKAAKQVMESAPQLVKHSLGVDFSMPLKVEAEMGKDWFNMKEIKL